MVHPLGDIKSANGDPSRRMVCDRTFHLLDTLMPLAVHEKVLRAVEYGTLERAGSSKAISVDLLLVAPTSVDRRGLV